MVQQLAHLLALRTRATFAASGVHKRFKNNRKSIQVDLGDAPRGQNSAETIIFIAFDVIAKVYIMEGPDALESCRAS